MNNDPWCTICHQLKPVLHPERHKCPPVWYCWFDDGDDGYYNPDDGGVKVYAVDAHEAAADFCAAADSDSIRDSWSQYIIVKSATTDAWVKVYAEASIEWHAPSCYDPEPFTPQPCREVGLRPQGEPMSKSAIPYVDFAWPVVTGCTKIHPQTGCANCYAARLAATRLKHHPHYEGLAVYRDGRGHWLRGPRFNEDTLTDPLRWRKPRRVFVAQTGDLFHKVITQEQIFSVWKTMCAAKQHTFLVFTKRWARASEILRAWSFAGEHLADNVWVVFSASTQDEVDEAAPLLLDTPAAKRGLSLEPLLEVVRLRERWLVGYHYEYGPYTDDTREVENTKLDFVFAGGESSLRRALARPCPVEAARSLRDQCQEAGVAFWWKQWGAHLPPGQVDNHTLDGIKYEELP